MDPHDPGAGDDNGAPWVEFIVPDDARELDRDVQAYHRELRQRRRTARWRALAGRFRRRGVLLPLSLAALALVAMAATLITVLAPGPTDRASKAPLAARSAARPGEIGGLLPDVRLGVSDATKRARALRPAVIALIPPDCACGKATDELYRQARAFSLRVYFVASRRPPSELRDQIGTAGHGLAVPVHDRSGALESAYTPSGLTAVLVRRDGIVTDVVRDLKPDMRLGSKLSPLRRSP